jgi:hypothetical protein
VVCLWDSSSVWVCALHRMSGLGLGHTDQPVSCGTKMPIDGQKYSFPNFIYYICIKTTEPDPLVINGAGNCGLIGGLRRGVANLYPLVTSRHYPQFASSRH